jgi:hydroxyacyl-ACP dehydratase HTD2-like protein with hotdog domain
MTILLKHLREIIPESSRIIDLTHRADGPLFADENFSTNIVPSETEKNRFDLFVQTESGAITMRGSVLIGDY